MYSWEQRKFGDYGKCKSGVGFPEREQGGKDGIPFYKVSDMNLSGNEKELITANNYVSQEQIDSNCWTIIKAPAIFFAKVGAAVLLDRKRLVLSDFLLDNNTMAYKIDDNIWDCDFCYYTFQKTYLPNLIQVGALPSYNGSQIESLSIFVAKNDEQKKIGTFFKELDNLITLHQRK